MDIFGIDSEISFEDWRRTIYLHAMAYMPPKSPEPLLKAALRTLNAARENERAGRYDAAYFYILKCLEVFDATKCGTDVRKAFPKARLVMAEAMDAHDSIKKFGLPVVYKERLEEMRRMQSKRRSTISQQLENDPSVDFSPDAHLQRQRQLLDDEQDVLSLLRAKIGGVSPTPPTPQYRHGYLSPVTWQPPAPEYGAPQRVYPAPLPQYGGPPYNLDIDASPGPHYNNQAPQVQPQRIDKPRPKISVVPPPQPRYAHWQFNMAKFPMTAARRGIVNLGNTCYMNSVLQVLNCTPLADYFMRNEYHEYLVSDAGSYVKVTNAFIYTMRELRRPECNYSVSASPFRKAIGDVYEAFSSSSQQDANEFLRVLLDAIHSALNEKGNIKLQFPDIDNTRGSDEELSRRYWSQYMQLNSSVVSESCAFQERSMLVCPSCRQTSRSFATNLSIEVPISNKLKIAIEDCLAAYTAPEMLGQDSLYSCPSCKKKVRATKRLQFYSAPRILFITLKRFRTFGDFSNMAKVNDEVYFERSLDLAPFMCSNFPHTQFNLAGVVDHQGNMHGGHYTADTLGSDRVWCNFSDERVLSAGAANFRQAYILCYVRTT